MIEGKTPEERLKQARKLFEDAWDYQWRWSEQAEADIEFRSGNQWDREDLAYLKQQKRPALTFNLIRAKLAQALGSAADNDVTPSIESRTGETFLAEVLSQVIGEIYEEFMIDDVDDDVLEDGFITGIGVSNLDVVSDSKDPRKLKFVFDRIHPCEVIWDPGSEQRDKSDAAFFARSHWMTKGEFKQQYPEHAAKADEIFTSWAGGIDPNDMAAPRSAIQSQGVTDYIAPRKGLWYDARRHQVRVVRMQCKKFVKSTVMMDPLTGRSRKVDPALKAQMREQYPDLEFATVWDEVVYWYDFLGTMMLYDGESPLPFDGFSVTPFVFDRDGDNLPIGMVRDLRDPQKEVNKQYSQTLHWIMSQSAPGIIAEDDAVKDQQAFREEMKRPGDVAWVRPGAIAQQKIQQRQLPVMPEAIAHLGEMGIRLIDMISGTTMDDLIEPRGIPEAAATTQLKHRRSMMSMRPALRRWYRYRREVARKIVESVVNSMPDDQIAELLGSRPDYTVAHGRVMKKKTELVADLSNIPQLNAKIAMVPSDKNNSDRVLEFQALLAVAQLNQPIDPEVMFDTMALSPSKRERLKKFALEMRMQAAEQQKSELESVQRQLALEEQKERAKIAEEQRSNLAKEAIATQKTTWEFQTRLLDIWERADDAERDRIVELVLAHLKAQQEEKARQHEQELAGAQMVHERGMSREERKAKAAEKPKPKRKEKT